MIINRKSFPSIATVCIMSCALMVGVWLLLAKTVDTVVKNDAEAVAMHWVSYFDDHLDNIETLITQCTPNQEQSTVIDIAVDFGEVFLFKIFRPDGTTSIDSDKSHILQDGESSIKVNEKALHVFNTGISNIATNDGQKKAIDPMYMWKLTFQ